MKDKDKILKAKRGKWQITYKELPSGYQLIYQQKLYKPERNGTRYFKWWKGRTYNQEYSTHQDSHSDLMEKTKTFQTRKFKRIQQHQTSFTKHAKGNFPSRKCKRRKRPTEKKHKTIKKTVIDINNYLKCKWIKFTNQKTQTGWADENMWMYALTTSLCLTHQTVCNYFIFLG